MPQHLYAETLLAPGLGVAFLWRYQNNGRELLAVIDPESPVYRAVGQAIDRFENTVFDVLLNHRLFDGMDVSCQAKAKERIQQGQEQSASLQVCPIKSVNSMRIRCIKKRG